MSILPISLSKSSLGTFKECERQWLLQQRYWQFPPAIKCEAQYQRKLMTQNALVGQVVDDVITYSLRLYQRKQKWPESPEQGAATILDQYVRESERWLELYRAKVDKPQTERRQPLASHFFGEPLSEAEKSAVLADAGRHLAAWFASPVPDLVTASPLETWRVPEAGSEPPSFEFEGIRIWAKYDFAIQTEEQTILFDWKTGRVNESSEANARDQLHTYALFAESEWKSQLDRTRLYAVWLSAGPEACLHEVVLDVEVAERLKAEWREANERIMGRLAEAGRDADRLMELFPMTSQVSNCKYCKFRICEGYLRVQPSP